jgi:heme exporter protein A
MWKIVAENLTQKFNRRMVFGDISFQVESGNSLALAGPNGSGKTTLVRVICQLLRPTSGNLKYYRDENQLGPHDVYSSLGLVGPYLQLYNDLTALENFSFFSKIRGMTVDNSCLARLMDRLGLRGRELDELRTFSSGMLQRMKYVIATMHDPHILILDEPSANLDEAGIAIVHELMEEQRKKKILIIATNEPEELKFGREKIYLSL